MPIQYIVCVHAYVPGFIWDQIVGGTFTSVCMSICMCRVSYQEGPIAKYSDVIGGVGQICHVRVWNNGLYYGGGGGGYPRKIFSF